MNKKTFSNSFIGAVLILLIVTGLNKVYPVLSFNDKTGWNYEQIQKVDKTKNEFSFVVFGDTRDAPAMLKNIIEKINQEDVDFAIHNGDFVTYGQKEEFRLFLNQIKKINKPLLTVIGNHDVEDNGRINYYELFGESYYSFFVGNSYFIILDNANEKDIDSGQMYWLRGQLQESQKYKYRFVFMHVPLYDPRKGDYKMGHSLKDLNFAKKLNDIFDKNNITMLFVSHIHGYFKGMWRKTPYILTGGGVELAGTAPEHYFHHYIKVRVSDTGIQYEVVKIGS